MEGLEMKREVPLMLYCITVMPMNTPINNQRSFNPFDIRTQEFGAPKFLVAYSFEDMQNAAKTKFGDVDIDIKVFGSIPFGNVLKLVNKEEMAREIGIDFRPAKIEIRESPTTPQQFLANIMLAADRFIMPEDRGDFKKIIEKAKVNFAEN